MTLEYRETRFANPQFASFPDAERPRSRELLLRLGIKLPPSKADLASGRVKLWECVDGSQVLGHCAADLDTGEILILGVRSHHEGQGIGKTLLAHAVNWLRAEGASRIWLVAPSDPTVRAFGFYRALGWRATGDCPDSNNEVLEFPGDSHLWLSI